jgi:hypothetical protein
MVNSNTEMGINIDYSFGNLSSLTPQRHIDGSPIFDRFRPSSYPKINNDQLVTWKIRLFICILVFGIRINLDDTKII